MPAQPERRWLPWLLSLGCHAALAAGVFAWLAGRPEPTRPPVELAGLEEPLGGPAVLWTDPPRPPAPAVAPRTVTPTPHAAPAPIPLPTSPAPAVAAAGPSSPGPPLAPGPRPGLSTPGEPLPRPGQTVVFVLDRSASMGDASAGPDRFAAARRLILDRLRRLSPSNRFQIVAYNGHPEPFRPADGAEVPVAGEPQSAEAERWLSNLAAEGRSDHLAALRQALTFRPDVIYWLTDGDDLRPELPREIERLNRGHARLNTVALTPWRERGQSPLMEVARASGGVYQVAAGSSSPSPLVGEGRGGG
jgi:hypothetical protein